MRKLISVSKIHAGEGELAVGSMLRCWEASCVQNDGNQIRVKLMLLGFAQVRRANGRKPAWFEAGGMTQHG